VLVNTGCAKSDNAIGQRQQHGVHQRLMFTYVLQTHTKTPGTTWGSWDKPLSTAALSSQVSSQLPFHVGTRDLALSQVKKELGGSWDDGTQFFSQFPKCSQVVPIGNTRRGEVHRARRRRRSCRRSAWPRQFERLAGATCRLRACG
jgi:hypothetical protein